MHKHVNDTTAWPIVSVHASLDWYQNFFCVASSIRDGKAYKSNYLNETSESPLAAE